MARLESADARFFAACEAYHRKFGTRPFYAFGVPKEMMTGYLERAVETGIAEFDPHDWLPPDSLA